MREVILSPLLSLPILGDHWPSPADLGKGAGKLLIKMVGATRFELATPCIPWIPGRNGMRRVVTDCIG